MLINVEPKGTAYRAWKIPPDDESYDFFKLPKVIQDLHATKVINISTICGGSLVASIESGPIFRSGSYLVISPDETCKFMSEHDFHKYWEIL